MGHDQHILNRHLPSGVLAAAEEVDREFRDAGRRLHLGGQESLEVSPKRDSIIFGKSTGERFDEFAGNTAFADSKSLRDLLNGFFMFSGADSIPDSLPSVSETLLDCSVFCQADDFFLQCFLHSH